MRRNTTSAANLQCMASMVGIVMLMATSAEAADKFYPPNSVVYGRTYADWSAAWHQWADSLPAAHHPLFDTADCSAGQSGPVWFLGGRNCAPDVNNNCEGLPAVRTCNVPVGTALYFPVLNAACLDAEAEYGFCLGAGPIITEMRAAIADAIDQTTDLEVTLDRHRIKLEKGFRLQSPVYQSMVPDGSLYQALGEQQIIAGTYLGVDDGIYVMLRPLSKGSHTLNFKGTFPQWEWTIDTTYNLIVE